jgi:hypothetical protein
MLFAEFGQLFVNGLILLGPFFAMLGFEDVVFGVMDDFP